MRKGQKKAVFNEYLLFARHSGVLTNEQSALGMYVCVCGGGSRGRSIYVYVFF